MKNRHRSKRIQKGNDAKAGWSTNYDLANNKGQLTGINADR